MSASPAPLAPGLSGRPVLVVGGAGAIGRAVCEVLADQGARPVVADSAPAGDWLAAIDGAVALSTDLTRPGAAEELVTEAWRHGVPAGVVYLAAVLRRQPIEDVSEADWEAQHAVTLRGAFFVARAAARRWQAADQTGAIVLATSQGWWTGGVGNSLAYNSAKGGVTTLVHGLASTYGPAGIRVNGVAPGAIDTPMLHAGLDPQVNEAVLAATPLRRLGRPSEVAQAVAFLLGDHASFVTSAILNVTGGWLPY